jgi:hypothetical protein
MRGPVTRGFGNRHSDQSAMVLAETMGESWVIF